MWKSRWVIVVAALAVTLLVGSTGVALAQGAKAGSEKTLVARVAQILGIQEQKVQDAFDQAQKEMREEALNSYLKSAVEQGRITQEQADKYKQWWQSQPATPELDAWQNARPDIPLLRGSFEGPGFRGGRGGFMGW